MIVLKKMQKNQFFNKDKLNFKILKKNKLLYNQNQLKVKLKNKKNKLNKYQKK